MTDPLTAAVACAAFLTGLPPADISDVQWYQRRPTAEESGIYGVPGAVGLFLPYRNGIMYADPDDESVLIHEVTHFLQWKAGKLDELLGARAAGDLNTWTREAAAADREAYAAGDRAEECE